MCVIENDIKGDVRSVFFFGKNIEVYVYYIRILICPATTTEYCFILLICFLRSKECHSLFYLQRKYFFFLSRYL